ncbi:interferon kappa-like [Trichomycterus rosablanca]|uniref:interferon kappa-like n=1 Tax=Trichomycterus rosablanca TaxID=2290929 RepID=UPI002F3563C2
MIFTVRFFLWLVICSTVLARCNSNEGHKRTSQIIQKLCNLGEIRPVRCSSVAESMIVQFPKLPKKESKRLLVLGVSFRLAFNFFMRNSTAPEWNSMQLRQLRELLFQQSQFYKSCIKFAIRTSAHDEVKKWKAFWTNLDHFLSEESFSSCAWESARPVIQHVMFTSSKPTSRSQRIRRC